jgi:hypothetical protein
LENRSRGLLRWLELGLLLLVALWALVFQLTLPSRQATNEDYRQVAEALGREAKPGDVVLLFPWWTERARLFLPTEVPVVGYLHSEADPLIEHPRIWLLAQPRLPNIGESAFNKAFLPDRTEEGPPRRMGNLTLTLYRNGRHRPLLFSAVESVAKARVYLERPNGERQDCTFDGHAHQCPGGLHVAAEWHELFYEPRYCLWMHPPGGDARLVAEFPDVPQGSAGLLEGGIVWEHALPKDTTPLSGAVEDAQSHSVLAELHVPIGVEGFQKSGWTPSPAAGRTLRVWTQSDNPKDRDACLSLRIFGEGGAAP